MTLRHDNPITQQVTIIITLIVWSTYCQDYVIRYAYAGVLSPLNYLASDIKNHENQKTFTLLL